MIQRNLLRKIPLLLLVPVMLISCQAARNSAEKGKTITLSALARKHARYEGKEIQLEGTYLGWKHGDCKFPAAFSSMQITRSDWAFSDGRYCCFVTGAIPAGLASTPEHPVPVKLTAVVKSKDSKVYLEYVSFQLLK